MAAPQRAGRRGASAYEITEGYSRDAGSTLATLEAAGFKRVTFTNGYDYSTHYDLSPKTEEQVLATGLLGQPFKF